MEPLIAAAVLASLVLTYFQTPGVAWVAVIIALIGSAYASSLIGTTACMLLIGFVGLPTVLLSVKPVRRRLITPTVLTLFKRVLPDMSDTERDALEAGTTWWDAELFSGRPHWNKLIDTPLLTLTEEEQSFLDIEVNQLCSMVNDWEASQVWQDLPPQAWQFVKEKGFLGMIIPKQYGGKAFSAYMHSQVIMKLSTRSSALAVSVMVPNSLGPAELLLHYGTDEQKDYYLPRLASGTDIPCFALTSPYAGSDAAAIPDVGVVCRGQFEGQETLGLRVTWNKRYITLGPIATVLGLAFRTQDPERLLSDRTDLGITCALIPTKHKGVLIGRRHWPLNAVFQNGPTSGKDVFIPIDWVIGGRAQIGKGWRMLMECLAAGRAISLPSANVGMAKLAVRGTSAYSAIRHQFKTAIGNFEGVQEPLARMGGNLYMMDAARRLAALAVTMGERPSVLSAIAKYHVTERARWVVNDAMDILGGKGICMGPSNFLARAYQQMPIAITVEGANILTRSLIIFGQGAVRCHPYVLKEMQAAIEWGKTKEADREKAVKAFDAAFFGHAGFMLSNCLRALLYSVSGGLLVPTPDLVAPEMRNHYRAVNRISTAFALLADCSMLVLGSSLKRRERISARLGDILSQLFLITAVLKRFEDEGRQRADLPYVYWSVQDALTRARHAWESVLQNFPNHFLAAMIRCLTFPAGMPYRAPTDALSAQVAHAMQTQSESRDRLLADAFVPTLASDPICCGEQAFRLLPVISAIEIRLRPLIRSGSVHPIPQSLILMQEWAMKAAKYGVINPDEYRAMTLFARLADASVRVDDFSPDLNAATDLTKRQQQIMAAKPIPSKKGATG